MITGNITIGRGSVIGANSVVLKDVPALTVVTGNPARIIKMYNPQSGHWERVNSESDVQRIEESRNISGMPSRQSYAEIIDRNSRFKEVNHIAAGNGVCI